MPGLVPYEGQSSEGSWLCYCPQKHYAEASKNQPQFIIRLHEALSYGGNIKFCLRRDSFFGGKKSEESGWHLEALWATLGKCLRPSKSLPCKEDRHRSWLRKVSLVCCGEKWGMWCTSAVFSTSNSFSTTGWSQHPQVSDSYMCGCDNKTVTNSLKSGGGLQCGWNQIAWIWILVWGLYTKSPKPQACGLRSLWMSFSSIKLGWQ